jgi:hypothetical protein
MKIVLLSIFIFVCLTPVGALHHRARVHHKAGLSVKSMFRQFSLAREDLPADPPVAEAVENEGPEAAA